MDAVVRTAQRGERSTLFGYGGIRRTEVAMAWFYVIRDHSNGVVKRQSGYKTESAAMNAARQEARALQAAGKIPGSGLGTITAGQDSEAPSR
jgi:hypothetical protein